MTRGYTEPASLPPPGLPGLNPDWSRLLTVDDGDETRTWHVLDNQVPDPTVTVVAVHGNPTWSYLWRRLLSEAPEGIRVLAVDQLDMGFSERTGVERRLARRIDDLERLIEAAGISGPVVVVAHDWGGPISLGWASRNRERVAGIVLINTAVQQPAESPVPRLIRLVRNRWLLRVICQTSRAFIRGANMLSRPRLNRTTRRAYEAPYTTAGRREAIATFVADIPLDESHPSHSALDHVAAGLDRLTGVPALLLWGPADPVFSEIYLRDLSARLPQAEIHRFEGASHLVAEDTRVAPALFDWIGRLGEPVDSESQLGARPPLWASLDRRQADDVDAIVEMGQGGVERSISFRDLAFDVRRLAAGLSHFGVEKGDRVALLIPPGIDLAISLYACWRIGAVVVVADAGLGARGMTRALKSADPDYLIGIPKALAAARSMSWPGVRISSTGLSPTSRRILGVACTLDEIRSRGEGQPEPIPPESDDEAAIGFTSGATGPAKGVAYRHHQMQAQRDALMALYGISDNDRLVAAFGPFALYGPMMGIASVVPDMEVTAPGSLTGQGLAEAARAIDATLVFASPAALRNVVETSGDIASDLRSAMERVRLVMSAGAPVPADTLGRTLDLMPNAEAHTPYGMTEVLPVADISLTDRVEVGPGNGVCVGFPVEGVEVRISPLDSDGVATGELSTDAEVVGEVCIRSAHMRDGYDQLWWTEHTASQPEGWHRSGDVGHLDDEGRLWIEGRMGHIISSAYGPVTPVGIEQSVVALPEVANAAVVGVGPPAIQLVVVVVATVEPARRAALAGIALADRVRDVAAGVDVAAVLIVPEIPVDKRHNSKVDRARIARWAEQVLAGGRMGSP